MDLVLALRDDWVCDSWVADDGENYHLFFLTAPRALLGFRNLEPDASALEIIDPIPVALRDGELIDVR